MNPSKFKQTINIIFFVLLIGMLAFTVVSYLFTLKVQQFIVPDTNDIFLFVVPAILVMGIVAGNVIFKKLNAASHQAYSIKQKLSVGLTSNIIRYALIEASVLISIVAFMGSANLFYMMFVLIGLLYFITLRPSDKKLKKDLALTHDECVALGIQQ